MRQQAAGKSAGAQQAGHTKQMHRGPGSRAGGSRARVQGWRIQGQGPRLEGPGPGSRAGGSRTQGPGLEGRPSMMVLKREKLPHKASLLKRELVVVAPMHEALKLNSLCSIIKYLWVASLSHPVSESGK